MSDEKNLPLNCDRDPARWAREFDDVLAKEYNLRVDEGWLIGWFANAMMCGEDTYRWKLEKEGRVHPEGGTITVPRDLYQAAMCAVNRDRWASNREGDADGEEAMKELHDRLSEIWMASRLPQLSEGSK
jgi:hypothetical protein